MLTLSAPAKLNLTLEVLGQRPDGYHEIRSIFQTINLRDRLSFESDQSLVYQCASASWQAEKSLVSRAAQLLKETGVYPEGAIINLIKQIPLRSGLGGDSSDAAIVLRGLNQLWGLNIAPGKLVKLAARLGSDVPFFMSGGTALVQGRGEFISPLPSITHSWIVLLVPPVPLPESKTAALYAGLKPENFSNGIKTEEMVIRLTNRKTIAPECFFNVFEQVAYSVFDGLERYRHEFHEAGAGSVHLAGSGPALYSLFRDKSQAARVYDGLKSQELEAYLVDTLDSID